MISNPLVVQVLWSFGRAGAERMVLDLARALPQHGFRSRVIAAGGGGEMEKDFLDAGVEYAIGPVVSSFRRFETVNFLKRQIAAYPPAIWHAHLSEIWAGWALRSSNAKAPFVVTAHNDDRDDPWLRHKARGMAFRDADKVVCISKVVQRYVAQEFHVPSSETTLIRNGIDFRRVIGRPVRSFSEPARLITVGRLVAQKDHATLLKALARIKQPWQLDILGQGSEQPTLERLAGSLKLTSRVHFLGSVTNVAERLSRSDLFLFPSRWEGQGLALLEAAAAGVPIIASDLPVFHETFDAHSLAFAKPQDVSAWTRAIETALANPEQALTRARRAEEITRREFALDRMVDKYVQLYRDVIARI